jgi:hypothetical protein
VKIKMYVVEEKLAHMGKTIRSLRDEGLPRAVYNELSGNDEPDLSHYEICTLGNLIDEEPLNLIGPEEIASLMKSLPVASELPNPKTLNPKLLAMSRLENITDQYHSSIVNPSSEIDINSRLHKLNEREVSEWEALKGSKYILPKVGWINLLPEDLFVSVAEKLKSFENGLRTLSKKKMKMAENLASLDTLLNYAEEVNKAGQIEEFFTDERYQIFYKRLDRPLVFHEIEMHVVQTSSTEYEEVGLEGYDYELRPIVTRHCFIVAPSQMSRSKGCIIFNASPHSEAINHFASSFNENPLIDSENWKKYSKKIVQTEEPGV